MLTLHKLINQGIQEVISRLEGGRKQSMDAYSIGSTVQPVVEVNIGRFKEITVPATAGNSSVSYTVPVGKVWVIDFMYITLSTDANVANRYLDLIKRVNSVDCKIVEFAALAASLSSTGFIDGIMEHISTGTGGLGISNLDNVEFLAGDIIKLSVASGVAGDSFSGIIRIREFDVR